MDTFDQSLKLLLHEQPADFVRFALDDPAVGVREPLPSALPSRSRDVDGVYCIVRGGAELVAHIEFHRRRQSAWELAVDVGDAQLRLHRRERKQVVSLVWDLYGAPGDPVVAHRSYAFGAPVENVSSRVVYLRVNLRGQPWQTFLSTAPPSLWPLVALAAGGACEEAVCEACNAIEGRTDLSEKQRAEHLAVLWFVSEAESVPVAVMKGYIPEEKLMASTLYQSIFEKGEARATARERAETILQVLSRRLGGLDPEVETRLRGVSNLDLLKRWLDEALDLQDAASARRFVDERLSAKALS